MRPIAKFNWTVKNCKVNNDVKHYICKTIDTVSNINIFNSL